MAVAHLDEVGDLFRGVGVDNSAELWRFSFRAPNKPSLVSDYADRDAFYARVAGNHFPRIVRLKLIKLTIINQTVENIAHIVRKPMVSRYDVVDIGQRPSWTTSLLDLHPQRQRWRKLGHQLAEFPDALFVIPCPEMRDA